MSINKKEINFNELWRK